MGFCEIDKKAEAANIVFCLDTRNITDNDSFENVKSDIKAISEDAFDRYDDIKIYVYYQRFGSNFRATNHLLKDANGNEYFTSYDEAEKALDKLERFLIKSSFWTYDFVEATQFMIDTCDDKIIAMYHIAADDCVMGSIDDAKKLTQTVCNSKYITANDEEIQRIYVSTLCPNSAEPFDTDSYAYKLAELSGGIAVTGYDMVEEIEIQSFSIEVSNAMSSNTSSQNSVISNLKQILGEGDEGVYKIISSAGWTTIKLKNPLTEGSDEDYDEDGLSDWKEVNTNLIYTMYAKNNHSYTPVIKSSYLPTLADCKSYYTDINNQKIYVKSGYEIFINKNAGMYYHGDKEAAYAELSKLKILPILSDPTKPDSDGDRIPDCITFYNTEEYKKHKSYYYFTEFDDPNPLKFEYLWQWPALDKDNGNKLTRIAAGLEDDRTPPHGAIDIGTLGIHHNAVASADGVVIDAYNNYYEELNNKTNCGNYVFIMHEIKGVKYFSRYIHLETVNVEIGDEVHAGDIIGKIGGTGKSDTNTSDQYSYHLDFQIGIIDSITKLKDGTYSYVLKLVIDPLIFNYECDKYGTNEITRKTYDMLINIPRNIDHTCTGGEEYFDDSGNKQNYSCHDCLKLFNCQEYFIHMEEVHNEVSNDYICNDHCIKCRYKL